MRVKQLVTSKFLSMFIILTFFNSLTPYSNNYAEEVVISPDKVRAPTFRTSDAICYGSNAGTHINLGFGSSVTGKTVENEIYCTIGGGEDNTASGENATVGGGGSNEATEENCTVSGGGGNEATAVGATVGGGEANEASGSRSTVVGGFHNTASGSRSTVGGGSYNTAGGSHSWAGGHFMGLTSDADHTFVWGYSRSEQLISMPDAFLIFPAGTTGRVGVGTSNPVTTLHVTDESSTNTAHIVNRASVLFNQTVLKVARTELSGGNIFAAVAGTNADGTGGKVRMVVSTAGNVGIGDASPGEKLDIAGGNGRVESDYNWLTNSDFRLKQNISTLDNSLEKISHLRGVRFDSKRDDIVNKGIGRHIGVIAQELEKEYPELVVSDEQTGYKAVAYDKLTAVLIEAVKELKTQNEMQKTENEALKVENASLRRDIEKIKAVLGITDSPGI